MKTVVKQLFMRTRCQQVTTITTIFTLSTLLIYFSWTNDYAAVFLRGQNHPRLTPQDKWISVGINVTLFSAFYDDRAFRSKPVVVLLGLEKQSDRSTRYKCWLLYQNGRNLTTGNGTPLQVLTRVHWVHSADKKGGKILNYRPFSFNCILPTPEIPKLITIVSEKRPGKSSHSKNNIENVINSEKFVSVTTRKNSMRRRSYGVCVSSPIFKIDNPQQLIDTFEMNRLLGAEFFTVYIYQISLESRRILEKYSNDGLAEVVKNWGENFPGEAHYYGQLLSITDCLYRNIYRVNYVVYTDLDEVIVPVKHPDWNSLMKELDDPVKGCFIFEMVLLKPVEKPWTKEIKCPSGNSMNLKSSRFATFRNRSNAAFVSSRSRRSKYITKTNVTLIAQIHYAEKLVHGYIKEDVPINVGLLYHYRVPYLQSRKIKIWIVDTIVARYTSRLYTAVRNVLCGRS